VTREPLLARAERIADAYGLVLTLIMVTFVVVATLPPHGWGGRVIATAMASLTAILALTSSGVREERVRGAVALGAICIAAAALARLLEWRGLLIISFFGTAALLTIAAVTILRRVVAAATVEFRTILGAISVYTLLGLLFDYVFLTIDRIENGPFFGPSAPHAQSSDFIFFSYTTLTTTGYGNLVPAGQIGQIFAVFEMLTGQFFLLTLVAGLVSLWRPLRSRQDAAD
jgi:hypothetical protein